MGCPAKEVWTLSTRYTRAVHHPTAGRAGERQGMEVCGTVDHLLTRCCPRSGAFRALHVYKLPVKCGHRTTFPVRCRHRIRWTGGVPSLRPAGHSAGLGRDHLEGQARNEVWGPQLARRARTAQSCVPDSRAKHRTFSRPRRSDGTRSAWTMPSALQKRPAAGDRLSGGI
jgi:hypothetical protein